MLLTIPCFQLFNVSIEDVSLDPLGSMFTHGTTKYDTFWYSVEAQSISTMDTTGHFPGSKEMGDDFPPAIYYLPSDSLGF